MSVHTRSSTLCLGALLAAAAGPVPAHAAVLVQQALAHDRDTGTLRYRESHWLYREGGVARRLVLYQCPDGRAFARKTVREGAAAQAPDFDFEDGRDGYREGVRSTPTGRLVYVRERAGAPVRERQLELPANVVIDAGFDASVRRRWRDLAAGREVTQPFLLPASMAVIPVRLRPGPQVDWRGVPAQRLTMRLDRWYGFVAPSMQLTYAIADQRLLEFAGIASIRDAAGRHQDVRISFPRAPAPADAAGLQQALSIPLVRGCGG